jgi:hypothetical protein
VPEQYWRFVFETECRAVARGEADMEVEGQVMMGVLFLQQQSLAPPKYTYAVKLHFLSAYHLSRTTCRYCF